MRKHALVIQGGGMRGAYAAGALVALFHERRERFHEVWATSSGAASAAYAVAGQPEGLDIWRHHLHGNQLLSWTRALRGGRLLDLDYLVDEVFGRRIPLDVAALHRQNVPVHVPTTDVDTGKVHYHDLSKQDPFRVLRAAMSLPGAVKDPVPIDGRRFVDGGVVDQIPIRRAIENGATHVTVVLTRPATYQARPVGPLGMRLATRHFPKIAPALRQRHLAYQAEMECLTNPPEGITVRAIRPSPDLKMGRWTRGQDALLSAIEAGRLDALALPTNPSTAMISNSR